jgi:Putative Flp pilus-assembly TadE/G-like
MMRRLTASRRGNVTVMVALLLIPLVGMMALTLDGGLLMDRRRQCQTAADLAALAAATDMYTRWNTNAGKDTGSHGKDSAVNNAKANGFDNTTGSVTVNFNPSKYQGGQWQGQTIPVGYVEVIITYNQSRFFSAIWGQSNLQVQARAVARASYKAAEPGILILDPSSKGSLDITGNGGIRITGEGSVVVDSTNAAGGVLTGNGSIYAAAYYFSGSPGYSTSGKGTLYNNDTGLSDSSIIHSGVAPTPDPLASLPVPTKPSVATLPDGTTANKKVNWSGNNNYGASNGTLTLSPGTYSGGISVSNGNLVLQPGIYYMDGGGMSLSGSGSVTVSGPVSPDTGHGVLIYNAPVNSSDEIKLTGNGSVNLPAPTSGTYQGISIFQDRTSTAKVEVTGNGGMNINGTFYAAKGTLDITGNGGLQDGIPVDNIGSQYISYDLVVTGNGGFNIVYTDNDPISVRIIQLVE